MRQGGSYNHLAAGDLLVNNTGGGGYGDPLLRNPSRVAHDVKNGFVAVAAAERDYGVEVNPTDFTVNQAATAERRGTQRRGTVA